MVVADLSLHPRFAGPLVDAFFAEWPVWCARVGRPVVESILVSGPPGTLPLVLVACVRGEPAGTVALRPWFAEEPMEQTPWVRQLLVLPPHRGLGIDRALIASVEGHAREMGYQRLHAATNRIEPLLARRGWETFATIGHEDGPMAWMRKPISAR